MTVVVVVVVVYRTHRIYSITNSYFWQWFWKRYCYFVVSLSKRYLLNMNFCLWNLYLYIFWISFKSVYLFLLEIYLPQGEIFFSTYFFFSFFIFHLLSSNRIIITAEKTLYFYFYSTLQMVIFFCSLVISWGWCKSYKNKYKYPLNIKLRIIKKINKFSLFKKQKIKIISLFNKKKKKKVLA